MPIDISNKEGLDVPLTGTQMNDAIVQASKSKNAIANIEGIESTGTEIDGAVTQQQPTFSFIFDDGYTSHLSIVKPLFDTYGWKCGFAITLNMLENSNKMNINDLQSLTESGFELLSHSMNHIRVNETMNHIVGESELETSKDMLDALQHCKGFVAPYSAIHSIHQDTVDRNYEYAFTVYQDGSTNAEDTVITRNSNPTKLWRMSIDAVDETYILNAVNEAIKQKGSIVFYQHSIPSSGAVYDKLVYVMDLLQSKNLEVKTPYQAISARIPLSSTTTRREYVKDVDGYDITNWSSSTPSNATATVDTVNNKIICDSLAESLVLYQNYFWLGNNEYGKTLTFEFEVEGADVLGGDNRIGLKFRTSSSVDIVSKEVTIGSYDGLYRKYRATMTVPKDVERVLCFFRLDFTSSGQQVEVLNPKFVVGRKTI